MKTYRALLLAPLFALAACTEDGAATADVPSTADAARDAATDAPADVQPARCESPSLQPAARGDSAGAVDPVTGALWVFGGDTGPTVNCRTTPEFNNDLWRFDPAINCWQQVMRETAPSPRARMAYALDTRRRQLVIFGGRFRAGTTGNYTNYNDVWALDLATETWRQIDVTGDAPTARSNATAVYDPTADALVVFGGNTSANGLTFTPRNDTWALDLATSTWRRVTTTGSPPTTRLFHAAAVVGGAMVITGGGGADAFTGPFYSDAARLALATGAWSSVTLTGDTTALAGRISASLVPTGNGAELMLVGGHDDGALGNRNDVFRWSASGELTQVSAGDELNAPSSGFCMFPADFATQDAMSPERRSAFVLGVDPARNRAILYGGKTDCGLAADVWSLDLRTAAWRTLRGATDGLSCQRSGRENCRSLCN